MSSEKRPPGTRTWDVVNNKQELRFKLHPEFFISSQSEGIQGLAIASRMANRDPLYAQEILRSLYHEFGPSDEFMKDFTKFEAETYKAFPGAAMNYFSENSTPLMSRPGLLKKGLDVLKEENEKVFKRFDSIVFRADPFCAMARAAVVPISYTNYSVEMSSDMNDKKESRFSPDSIPAEKKHNLSQYLDEEILRHTSSSQYGLTERAKKIKAATENPSISLFTRPSLELSMSKEDMKNDVRAHLKQETKADSEVLADVLDVYRTALTYIATGGSNSYPILDHWKEVGLSGKKHEYMDNQLELVKTKNFDKTLQQVLAHYDSDSEKASAIVRKSLSPVMARMIEEKAQFTNETFPLHPGKIIWFDESKKQSVSLPERLNEEYKKQLGKLETITLGGLEEAQQRQVIKQGEILLEILGNCQKLFGDIKPEEMAAMYPLLGDGLLVADNQTTALALSQASQSSSAIANNIDNAFKTKVEFPLPKGADTLLQDLAKTLGKEIGVEYTSMGTEKKVQIPGTELYRFLQDKKTPDGLKRKIASFILRKFVGYPPDLNKTPDILGQLDAGRRQELIDFRTEIPADDPYFDITSDKNFKPEEAKKIIKLRLKLVHPDVNEDSETKRQATFLYNETMAYMDGLEKEKRQGIWATMKDI